MKFTFDEKEYDSDNVSEQGKAILAKLQNIGLKKNQLSLDYTDCEVLQKHYIDLLKTELSKENKQEDKQEKKD